MHDTPNNLPWCAIEVDDQGAATVDWAACSKECPFEEKAEGCMTTNGAKCQQKEESKSKEVLTEEGNEESATNGNIIH